MKKLFLTLFLTVMTTAALYAQQIIVVSQNGATNVFQTLKQAIEGSTAGSTIYLPGGSFSLSDEVKITTRLTILGIGHYAENDNPDGITTISGNLFFDDGSSGSAVMGCYISGNVYIGNDGSAVNEVVVKYCNFNSLQIGNGSCVNALVNQNYIRNTSNCNGAGPTLTNNVMHSLKYVTGGTIKNNIFTYWGDAYTGSLNYIYNSTVTYNVISCFWTDNFSGWAHFDNTYFSHNMHPAEYGEKCFNITGTDWNDIFENVNGFAISPTSNYRIKSDNQEYSECGIYGGTGFNDSARAPIPYIVAKRVDEKTDASGMLNVKIRVKAGE